MRTLITLTIAYSFFGPVRTLLADDATILGQITPFSLQNQDEADFTHDNLQGKVHVVNFIFTRCRGVCPGLTQQMKRIEKNTRHLKDKVRMVTISVDPEFDTPAVLTQYAAAQGADLARWDFLTGKWESVRSAVVNSFQSSMGKEKVPADQERSIMMMKITHGEKFIILDKKARIREFKTAKSMDEVKEIVAVVEKLVGDEVASR